MSVRSITGGTTSIKYTQITDTLVDITGVTNNTYFYNKADGLSYFKDNSGNIQHLFTGSSTASISTSGSISSPSISATTISATTYLNLPTDIRVTGATYSANTFTYRNNTGGTFNVLFNTVTGLTVNGLLSATNISGDGNGLTNINISSINTLQSELDSKILKPTNPLLDDYLYYNGSTWVPKRVKIPVSSGPGYTLFLATSGSTLPGYELLSQIPTTSPEEIESAITNNNVVQIDQYATNVLGRDVIDGGIWEYNSFAAVDIPSSGLTNILIGTYLRTSGGVETLLFTAATTNITTTAVTLYNTSVVQPEFDCELTDRLVVKYSASTNNTFNTTVYLYHGGIDNYSHIHTPFVSLHNDLAGLQGGSTDNYYHLELSQLNTLTLNNDASSLHNHYSTVLGLTGGTVSGLTTFNSGLSASTMSATTYYGDGSNLTGIHDYYITGATYTANTFTYNNINGSYFDVSFNTMTGLTIDGNLSVNGITTSSSISATTISATTLYGDGSNLVGVHDYYVTGATYSENTFTYTNNTGGTFSVLFNEVTGLTVNGILSATTISATTYYGDGSNLTGIIPPLTQGQIFIGDNTNSAAARNVTGDINIDYTGNTTIQSHVVTYDKIQTVSQAAVLGSTSTTGGTVEEIVMIEAYINASGTTATLLTNTSNWDINGVYIGTAITGTTQGQSHYNSDYWFTAIDDNSWIRMIRG